MQVRLPRAASVGTARVCSSNGFRRFSGNRSTPTRSRATSGIDLGNFALHAAPVRKPNQVTPRLDHPRLRGPGHGRMMPRLSLEHLIDAHARTLY